MNMKNVVRVMKTLDLCVKEPGRGRQDLEEKLLGEKNYPIQRVSWAQVTEAPFPLEMHPLLSFLPGSHTPVL